MGSAWRPGVQAIATLLRLVFVALVLPGVAQAQPAAGESTDAGRVLETGLPLFRNFSPKDYRAQPQNWAIVQDSRGVIYVGNGDGVLEFDGLRWRLIPVANQTSVRSLAVDAAGRVYVGAIAELGYLQPDAAGALRYVSLLERIPPEHRGFTDVRRTFATADSVYFSSAQRLFRLKGEQVTVWQPDSEFSMAFQVGQRLFVRELGRGLLELVDDELRLLPEGQRFAQGLLQMMLPLRDSVGDSDVDSVLIGTRNEGFFRSDGAAIHVWPTDVDSEIKRDFLYSGIALPNGRLLLGTLQGGLYLLDAQGRLLARLRKSDGLLDDTAYALSVDRQGGVWLALDRGIARVDLGQPLSQYDERNGLDGTVLSLQRHQGRMFAGTSQGVFKLVPGVPSRFEAIPGISGQAWALMAVDDALWVADNAGLFVVRDDRALPLRPSTQNALALHAVGTAPRRVFIGLSRGLASMRLEHGRWVDEGSIAGINDQVRSLLAMPDGRLWAGTRSTGVLRLSFPEGWSGGVAGPPPRVERLGLADGLPGLNHTEVRAIGNAAVFLTHQGIFRFDEARR